MKRKADREVDGRTNSGENFILTCNGAHEGGKTQSQRFVSFLHRSVIIIMMYLWHPIS